jgi:hypothetical protein
MNPPLQIRWLADYFPLSAHNQNHQKATPLPILDNRPADPLTR